jgi:hypothetical protein
VSNVAYKPKEFTRVVSLGITRNVSSLGASQESQESSSLESQEMIDH